MLWSFIQGEIFQGIIIFRTIKLASFHPTKEGSLKQLQFLNTGHAVEVRMT